MDFSPLNQLINLSPEQLASVLSAEQLEAVLTLIEDRIRDIAPPTPAPAPAREQEAAREHPANASKKSRWDSDSDDDQGGDDDAKKKGNKTTTTKKKKRAEDKPRQLDEYVVQEAIGEGTFGQVTAAFDKVRLHAVALKCVKLSRHADDGGVSTRYPGTARAEIQVLSTLAHPHLVKLYDLVFGPAENDTGLPSLHLALELFEGDLSAYMAAYVVEKALAQHVVQCIASALAYLHASNVIHRDVKPSNVFINRSDGRVALGDLGSARPRRGDGDLTPQQVTLWYRAPEILLDLAYDCRVDSWGLGCVLAELLNRGHPLFQASDEIGVFKCIFATLNVPLLPHRVRALDDVPRGSLQDPYEGDALELLLDLLEINPARRIDADQACAHAFLREDA